MCRLRLGRWGRFGGGWVVVRFVFFLFLLFFCFVFVYFGGGGGVCGLGCGL